MKKYVLSFLLLLVFGSTANVLVAQSCRSFLDEAKAAYAKQQYGAALKKLQDNEDCDPSNIMRKERQELYSNIFKAIDDQRILAENNAKKVLESAQKVLASESDTQQALRKAEAALDSLEKANAYNVRLLLAEAARNQQDLNFDAAVSKIKTAKSLNALPDSVEYAYLSLSLTLLRRAREDMQRKTWKPALAKIRLAGELNIQPDAVAAANQAVQHFLFENVRLDLISMHYDTVLENVDTLYALLGPADTVKSLYLEIAFCLTETGRLDRAAVLLDTLARRYDKKTMHDLLGKLDGAEPAAKANLLRKASQLLDAQRYQALLNRYLPPVSTKIPGGNINLENGRETCTATISPFFMATREVTFFEYDLYCVATNRPKLADKGWGRELRPIINVDWYDAVEYCNWRSRQEGLQEVYSITGQRESATCNWSANGYRLPTEAEWEFAAGNGTKQTRYSWGDAAPMAQQGGNVADETTKTKFPEWQIFDGYSDAFPYTAPTGSFAPNDFGLYDMSGNVWEWCWDRFDENYCRGAQARGPDSGSERVLRGGSWGSFPKDCLAGNRFHNTPDTRNLSIGFRLARNVRD